MNLLAEKLGRIERQIDSEKGPFNLFALLEREDLSDRWDLVVSASWASEDEVTLRYLAQVISKELTPEEVTHLARIVVLKPEEDPVRAITQVYDVEHGRAELLEPNRFGLPVKYGYIITSKRAA